MTDGTVAPVTHMFDFEGDDTDDPAEAVAFVAGPVQVRVQKRQRGKLPTPVQVKEVWITFERPPEPVLQ